jgi:hypothetical protein
MKCSVTLCVQEKIIENGKLYLANYRLKHRDKLFHLRFTYILRQLIFSGVI